ncbi:MAG TPA: hypothetical protein VJT74_01470 [Pyrinomonadaceae bacterium]|nr:hypothetical protein [Pyrinomonadaceae bacterium]
MLKGNRCERCKQKVRGARAGHKQTKYCRPCAKIKKKQNTLNPWFPEEQREYMRAYMRAYRRSHPKLSTRYVRRYRERKREAQVNPHDIEKSNPTQPPLTAVCLLATIFPFLSLVDIPSEGINLSFETLRAIITKLDIVVVEVTGLVVIVSYCLKHLTDIWKGKK